MELRGLWAPVSTHEKGAGLKVDAIWAGKFLLCMSHLQFSTKDLVHQSFNYEVRSKLKHRLPSRDTMIKHIANLLIILLITACGQAASSPITPPTTTIQTDILPALSPSLTPSLIPAVPTPTPTATPDMDSLVIITSSNARELDKITILTGHTDRVTDLVFSGDGAYLASTGYEGKIRMWDTNSWQQVATFPILEADLNTLAFSPDGSLLSCGQTVWNVTTGETVHTFMEHITEPTHVAFTSDGSRIAVEASGKITVWDVASWEEVLTFAAPVESRWLFGISFSPDGKWLAAGSGGNGTVYFWSAETGELAFILEQGNEHDVHDIAFTPDGHWLVTGGTDSFARLWDVSTREELQKMSLIGMYSLAISPDGSLLATAGPDRRVKLWDLQTGGMLVSLHHVDELMAVTFSPDGRLIASGGYDNTIVVWGISE